MADKNAEFIVTDSFHATAFSIIYNKEFYNIKRKNRNVRIENLSRVFKIENRFVGDYEWMERREIDYSDINQRISLQRERSIN